MNERLNSIVGSFLQHPAFADLPFVPTTSTPPPAILPLPSIRITIRDAPATLGCSPQAIDMLEDVLQQAVDRLEQASSLTYVTTMKDLSVAGNAQDEDWLRRCEGALATAVTSRRDSYARSFRAVILEEVEHARERHRGSSSACKASQAPASLTYPLPGPTSEPNGAFTEEVIEILRRAFEKCETLTRGEVKGLQSITKLNSKQIRTWFANQRQRRGRKPAPYLPPRRAPASQTPTKPFRNVSNSSTSSSLISYSSSSSDKAHHEFHESQNAYSSVDFDHSPPFESRMDIEDVPMPQLNSISPTVEYPRSLSIPTETGPFPVSSIPPAPTTAETDRFFSSQQFSSPLPPRSNETYDVQYLPAQMPSTMNSDFLDQLQRTDPFLDDEFLKNVFGTLGVTQGGGLTLTMDSFQDEGEMSSGSGGSEGRGGSREAGQGSVMMEFARGGGAGVGGPAGGFAFEW